MTVALIQEYVEDACLLEDHYYFINKANQLRESLHQKPYQSFFRVYALLIVRDDDGRVRMIHGANCEPCYIGALFLSKSMGAK